MDQRFLHRIVAASFLLAVFHSARAVAQSSDPVAAVQTAAVTSKEESGGGVKLTSHPGGVVTADSRR